MGIADRREREKAKRRDTIVDAAEELFFSKGIANTTIDEIAETVELSKATIYLYFKTKEEIYCAIVQRAMNLIKTSMQEAAKKGKNGLECLYLQGQAFYEFYKTHPNYFSALFHRELYNMLQGKENPMIEDILTQGEELFESAVAIIKSGIEDGSIRPDVDPYKAALSLDGIFSGLLKVVSIEEDHLMKYHNVTPEELIRYSMELIGHALINKDNDQVMSQCKASCPEDKKSPGKKQARKKIKEINQ